MKLTDHLAIPPYTGPDVEPAWPRRVEPWPPPGFRVVVENPDDPYSAAWLEPVQERRKQR